MHLTFPSLKIKHIITSGIDIKETKVILTKSGKLLSPELLFSVPLFCFEIVPGRAPIVLVIMKKELLL